MAMFYAFLFNKYDRTTLRLLADREIKARVIGTHLGLGHYVVMPVLMLLVYTFVFSVVFSVRWPGTIDSFSGFALRVFAGLIPFQFFAEVVNRAPGLVLENSVYVKKVVFPIETLVPTTVVVALFSSLITFIVFLAGYFCSYGLPTVTALWVITLWPPLILITVGLGWILASLGVFLRDLRQLVSILTSVMIFLAPIFYPIAMVPKAFEALIFANPLSYLIEAMRGALFDDVAPSLIVLSVYYFGGFGLAQLGYWVFMRTKKAFADVI